MSARFLFFALLGAACCGAFATSPVVYADDEDSWSRLTDGLQVRLNFARTEVINGTPIITTFVELRNHGSPLAVLLDWSTLHFTVTDSTGRIVPESLGPRGGFVTEPGVVCLPLDSVSRFDLRQSIAGVPANQAAHLEVRSGFWHGAWDFKRGDKESYYLLGSISVDPAQACRLIGERAGAGIFLRDDLKSYNLLESITVAPINTPRMWSGTIQIPRAKIPTSED